MLTVVGPVEGEEHARSEHPERPVRVAAVMEGLADLHLGGDLVMVPSRAAEAHELDRVHSERHLLDLRQFCRQGGGSIDGDTYATAASWDIALQAAGAGLVAIDELRRGRADLAFVAARPPGHHALADRSMGFCLINNVAVAAASLVAAGERVAIVDWDVHHGNGTEALFWDEPGVLYVSTHQWPCYPGTGRASDVGGPRAPGLTLNVPLPPGATGDVVRLAFERLVTPVVEDFAPTWVLVSAGFDAHRADPLADLALTAGDFADLARLVSGYAPTPGRLLLFLEGGYQLDALRASVAATLGALVGSPEPVESPSSGGPGREQLDAVATRRREGLDQMA
ncbi:MAG TPA: histone deacetylase [Acidimicrobiales bacterium]